MGAGNGGRRKKGREREAKSSKYCPGLSGQTPAVGSQRRENLKKKKKKKSVWEKFKLLIIT